jgi:hypothetical protein
VEGPQTHQYIFEPDTYVVVAEIENEFSLSRKVGHAEDITAQIFYKVLPRREVVVRVNRGGGCQSAMGDKVNEVFESISRLILYSIFSERLSGRKPLRVGTRYFGLRSNDSQHGCQD